MPKRQLTILLLFFISLFACKSTYTNSDHLLTLDDTAFPDFTLQAIETESQIFAIDASMVNFVESNVSNQATDKAKLTQLAYAIFGRTQLSLTYTPGANTTASQTFHNGRANCLSLTIMAYVMTRHLGLNTAFQDIKIPEFWTRRDGNTLINQHINLLVKPKKPHQYLVSRGPIVVDFDPQEGMKIFRATEITKAQMVSNFYVNKAADFLITNVPSSAYAYLRAAIIKDPKNAGAWLNLGVLFSKYQRYQKAHDYYDIALKLEPSFSSAYENLALLYRKQGEEAKAQTLLAQLHKKRIKNPYYHMVQGDIAIENESYKQAIKHYKEAISLNNKPHQFHFNLAKAYYALGDLKNAQRYLEKAKKRAPDESLSTQYASKLSTLLATR